MPKQKQQKNVRNISSIAAQVANKKAELDALRAQISELKKQEREAAPVTVAASEYKGHSMISFEGPFMPWSLSERKARILIENLDAVKKILKIK